MIGLNALREARDRIIKLFSAFDIFRKRDMPRFKIDKYEPKGCSDNKIRPTKLDFTRPRVVHQTTRKVKIVKKVIR